MDISPATTRRRFFARCAAGFSILAASRLAAAKETGFALRYMLASCMYGKTRLEEILPEVDRIGASAIDIWPEVHGNQREQLEAMGPERFAELLRKHGVTLGCITRYDLGPFALQDEMRLAKRLGCGTIVTGARGPKGLAGNELKHAITEFVAQLRPHLDAAEEAGVTLAIENHGNSLIESPDSLRWLVELCPQQSLGVAFAPYHLPQNPKLLAELIRNLGNRIAIFYAWQHGKGCMEKLPKEEELLQMPGRGPLDFLPILKALRDVNYRGFTEVFMHPVPRGIPIRPTVDETTAEINRARAHLETLLAKL